MNEQQLQEQFLVWLAQQVGAITEDGQLDESKLEQAVNQMGEEGLALAYEAFLSELEQQQVRTAKFGAKLNYINKLRSL